MVFGSISSLGFEWFFDGKFGFDCWEVLLRFSEDGVGS